MIHPTRCTTCHGTGGGDVYDPDLGSEWLECRTCEGHGSLDDGDCNDCGNSDEACVCGAEDGSKPATARARDLAMNGPLFAGRRSA